MSARYPAIVFDIDGTLANNSARQEVLQQSKYNWTEFFSRMGEDTPNESIVEMFVLLQETHNYKMLIVSARPEEYRALTEQWLVWNNIQFDRLYMRKTGDHRSDSMVKLEIARELKNFFDIRFVFDDRSSVVTMWRNEGFTCFQCYDHSF